MTEEFYLKIIAELRIELVSCSKIIDEQVATIQPFNAHVAKMELLLNKNSTNSSKHVLINNLNRPIKIKYRHRCACFFHDFAMPFDNNSVE